MRRLFRFAAMVAIAATTLTRAQENTVALRPLATVQLPSAEEFATVNDLIHRAARRHTNVDPVLIWALFWTESKYDRLALGAAGEIGLGQLTPVTARRLGVTDRTDRETSVNAVVRHMSLLLTKYRGNKRLALAAYNQGERRVDACKCVPSANAKRYVNQIFGEQYEFARRIVQYLSMEKQRRTSLAEGNSERAEIARLQNELRLLQDSSSRRSQLESQLEKAEERARVADARSRNAEAEAERLRAQLEQNRLSAVQIKNLDERLSALEKLSRPNRPPQDKGPIRERSGGGPIMGGCRIESCMRRFSEYGRRGAWSAWS